MTQKLSMVVYGDPKVGKTWLAATAPGPVLFLDAEAGGMRYITFRPQKVWDTAMKPPELDSKDLCTVPVKSAGDIEGALRWIRSGVCPFKTIVLDSLSELQSYILRDLPNGHMIRIQDWGTVSRLIEDLVVEIRDYASPSGPVEVALIISGADVLEDKKKGPMLQGRMKRVIGYKVDVIAHLSVATDNEGNRRRVLQLAGDDRVVAGHRLGNGVPDFVWDPSITKIQSMLSERSTE